MHEPPLDARPAEDAHAEPADGRVGAGATPGEQLLAAIEPPVPLALAAAVAAWFFLGGAFAAPPPVRLAMALGAAGVMARLSTRRGAMASPEQVAAASVATGTVWTTLLFALHAPACHCQGAWSLLRPLLDGMVVGALSSLPLLPLPVLIARACRSTLRARPGSLVALSDRRAVWVTTAAVIAACAGGGELFFANSLFAPLRLVHLSPSALVLLGGALSVAVFAFVRDARALGECLESTSAPGQIVFDEESAFLEERAGDCIDLGVGDERLIFAVDDGDPYRGRRRAEVLVEGSVELAHAMLVTNVRRDLLVALLALSLVLSSVLASLPW